MRTTSARFAGIFGLFVVVLGVVLGGTTIIDQQRTAVRLVLELGQEQRVAVSEISRDAYTLARKYEVGQASEASMNRLRNRVMRQELNMAAFALRVQPIAGDKLTGAMLERWTPFRNAVLDVVSSEGADLRALDRMTVVTHPLEHTAAIVVGQLADAGHKRVARAIALRNLAVILGLALFGIALRGLYVSTAVALYDLAAAIRRMAAGDLATPVAGRGVSEGVDVALAMDALRAHLHLRLADVTRRAAVAEARASEAVSTLRDRSASVAEVERRIRGPLRRIAGFSEMAETRAVQASQAVGDLHTQHALHSQSRHLAQVRDAAGEAMALLDSLRDESETPVRLSEVRVDELVQDAYKAVTPIVEGRGGRLVLEVPEPHAAIRTDAVRLRVALMQLMSRVAAASGRGPITLSTWQLEGEAGLDTYVSIADGVSSSDQEASDRTDWSASCAGLVPLVETLEGTLEVEGSERGHAIVLCVPWMAERRAASVAEPRLELATSA